MEKINEEEVRLLLKSAKRYREKQFELDAMQKGIIEKGKEIEYDLNKMWRGKIILWPEKSLFRKNADQSHWEILHLKVDVYKCLREYYFNDKDEPFLSQGKIPVDIHVYKLGATPKLITSKGMESIRDEFKKGNDSPKFIYNKPHCDFYQSWKSSTEITFNHVVCDLSELRKKGK